MRKKYNLSEIHNQKLAISRGDIIFLKGDLGAGKTTFSKHILNNLLKVKANITSPTYTYYNRYEGFLNGKKIDIYHFDLYRLSNYDEFFAIGAEEIFDNNLGIILVEWPDIIERYYEADININFFKTNNDIEREIEITKK